MRHAVLASVLALLATVILPVWLLEPEEPVQAMTLIVEQPVTREENREENREEVYLKLWTGAQIEELPLNEYLAGVVAAEMPLSFEGEALKAQAVAARTFAMRRLEKGKHEQWDLCGDSACCQGWISRQAVTDKLGESYWQIAEEAVAATEGKVLTYHGELIEAVYFSCSGGRTEEAVAVWGSEVPYLQSVPSEGEEAAAAFISIVELERDELQRLLPEAVFSGTPESWVGAVMRTKGGGVEQMELGGQVFTGIQLRSLLKLRSTNFTITPMQNGLHIEVLGYGHRVGMSQYGANAMAQAGSSWEEILTHYYTGAVVEDIGLCKKEK